MNLFAVNYKALLKRSVDLAALGAGCVSPNPMVGAVLVSPDSTIIGEGWHKSYGKAHAEVNCVAEATKKGHNSLVESTLIVSLTPCSITGNTPPCTDLVRKKQIPKVIIGSEDYTPNVKSESLGILEEAGCHPTLAHFDSARMIARFRNLAIDLKRPYIILKYARSADGFYGKPNERIAISNNYSLRLTHKWRAHSDAILVGNRTALTDDPELTQRYYYGKSPLRVLLDRNGKTWKKNLKIFNKQAPTLVFTLRSDIQFETHVTTVVLNKDKPFLAQVLAYLYSKKLHILLVEGGATLQATMLQKNLWDEIRVLESHKVFLKSGVQAPFEPKNVHIYHSKPLFNNTIHYYIHERLQKYLHKPS